MNRLTLIAPHSSRLFNMVRDRNFIIKTSLDADFSQINHYIKAARNNLTALLIRTNKTVSMIEPQNNWRGKPIVIYTRGIGKIRDIWEKLGRIKALDIVFFLPAEDRTIFRSLAFLSSLGIRCGFYFSENGIPAWEELTDLLYFAFYNRVKRAPIQPLEFIKDHPIISDGINYGEVFFNNPQKYIWLNENGKMAISGDALGKQEFLATELTEIYRIEEDKAYRAALLEWQTHFLKVDRCSTCPGWRICHGFHQKTCTDNHIAFFEEVFSIAADVQVKNKEKRAKIWQ